MVRKKSTKPGDVFDQFVADIPLRLRDARTWYGQELANLRKYGDAKALAAELTKLEKMVGRLQR